MCRAENWRISKPVHTFKKKLKKITFFDLSQYVGVENFGSINGVPSCRRVDYEDTSMVISHETV